MQSFEEYYFVISNFLVDFWEECVFSFAIAIPLFRGPMECDTSPSLGFCCLISSFSTHYCCRRYAFWWIIRSLYVWSLFCLTLKHDFLLNTVINHTRLIMGNYKLRFVDGYTYLKFTLRFYNKMALWWVLSRVFLLAIIFLNIFPIFESLIFCFSQTSCLHGTLKHC